MPDISFIQPDGSEQGFEAPEGISAMQAATNYGVTGIVGECGGQAICATCHVYVDEAWTEKTGHAEPMEEDMLDFAFDVRPNSRLSCQIRVRDELDGLVVRTPARQG